MILRFPQRRRSSQTLRIVLEREMNNRNDQMTHSERIEHMQKSGPCFTKLHIFIGPRSDHSLPMSVTDSLTHDLVET